MAIYSIVLLHTMLPHFHASEKSSHIHVHAHNYDHQNGHHNHDQENQISALDSFINFLGHLGHNEHDEEHLDNFIANINSSSAVNSDSFVKQIVQVLVLIEYQYNETEQMSLIDKPPILYEHLQCSSDPLRGPPSIA